MTDRVLFRAAVFVVLRAADEVFLLRRKNKHFDNNCWDLVSGHIEHGEGFSGCAIREAKEEAGVTVQPEALQLIHTSISSIDRPYINLFYVADEWSGDPLVAEPDVASEGKFFKLGALPTDLSLGAALATRALVDGHGAVTESLIDIAAYESLTGRVWTG
jgi:8-oxo-dGTP diphosphatase